MADLGSELVVFGESSIKSLSLDQLMEDAAVASSFTNFIEDDGGNNYTPHLEFWKEMKKFQRSSSEEKRMRAPGLVQQFLEGGKSLCHLVPMEDQLKLGIEPIRILEIVHGKVTPILGDCVRRFITSGRLPKKKSPLSSSSGPLKSSSYSDLKPSSPPSRGFPARKPLPPPPSHALPPIPGDPAVGGPSRPSSPPGGLPAGSKPPNSPPIDVHSLDEAKIKKLKLRDVMRDATLLQLFEAFLSDEMALENLLFYNELQAYRRVDGGDDLRIQKSEKIKEAFFSPSSKHALFCTAAEKESMEELKGTPRMFEVIEGRVMMELADLFRRFVSSGKLARALFQDGASSSSPPSSPPSSPSSPSSPPSSPLPSGIPLSSSTGKKKSRKSRSSSSSDADAIGPKSRLPALPPAPKSPPSKSKSPRNSPPNDNLSSPRLFGKKTKKDKERDGVMKASSLSLSKKPSSPPPARLLGESGAAVVKKLKLKDVFADEYLSNAFDRYIDAEMAMELLHFWRETRKYRALGTVEERIEKRDDIWTLFFYDKSPHRMHLTGAEREELEGAKKEGEAREDLFLNVESRVWMELSDALRKFISSGKLAATIESDQKACEQQASSPPPMLHKKSESFLHRKEKEKSFTDRSTKKEKKEREKEKEKEKEKDKKKKKEEVEKAKYAHLDPSDLTAAKNPKSLSLLDPATQEAILKAGIPVSTAEQDTRLWNVLMNALRFLKIDPGLRYTQKISPSAGVGLEEASKLLAGPVPSKLKITDQIGEGAFGQVFKCRCPPLGKGYFALKKMINDSEKHTKMNLREIQVLKENPHPNIVKFHAAYISKSDYWAVCELLEGGTLEEGHSEFLEGHVAYAAKQILSALNFLHSNKIVHRDLKSANIMLDVEGRIKLIDFGLSLSLANGPQVGMCGSPYWMSPEMIRMDPHSFPTDIWSFAVSLLEMINGVPPNRDNPLKLMFNVGTMTNESDPVISLENPAKWSEHLQDFLRRCLMPDPAKRATAEELLKHDLIAKACSKEKMGAVLSQIFIKHSLEDIGLGMI